MPANERDKSQWDEVYRKAPPGTLPWEQSGVSEELMDILSKGVIDSGRALDVCSASGYNTVYIAKQGFQSDGIDISSRAVELARERAAKAGVSCSFLAGDVLAMPYDDETFTFVFDRGCFHTIAPRKRKVFIREICRVLKTKGKYLLVCFTRRAWGGGGPPYIFTPGEIERYFSSLFNIVSLRKLEGKEAGGTGDAYLSVLMEKRYIDR
ncbi:MAG: class I SAM-dependent methyltransferase [Dehalococcoidia bacterium]|nr:class I SAM-dependent methyltransferase [Dehalococcoidia bacterium]